MDNVDVVGDSGDGWDVTRLTQVIAGTRDSRRRMYAYRAATIATSMLPQGQLPIRSHTEQGVCVGDL